MKNDYVVGYCRPPKGSRFVKGKSGNPRGRPKTNQYAHRTERTHLKDAMVEVLQQRIDLPQEGRAKRITIQRAMVKSLVDRAIQGHNASTAMIWKLFKHYGLDREPDERARYFRLTPSV